MFPKTNNGKRKLKLRQLTRFCLLGNGDPRRHYLHRHRFDPKRNILPNTMKHNHLNSVFEVHIKKIVDFTYSILKTVSLLRQLFCHVFQMENWGQKGNWALFVGEPKDHILQVTGLVIVNYAKDFLLNLKQTFWIVIRPGRHFWASLCICTMVT